MDSARCMVIVLFKENTSSILPLQERLAINILTKVLIPPYFHALNIFGVKKDHIPHAAEAASLTGKWLASYIKIGRDLDNEPPEPAREEIIHFL